MPSFYEYSQALLGSQTSAGTTGGSIDYRFAPSGLWSYSGTATSFVVEEARASNRAFNGDPTNEEIDPTIQIGAARAQTVEIGGIDRQVIWDYTFTVSLGAQTWSIGVIDVDLDNDDLIEAGAENGYFLVFPDGLPPANTDLTIGAITENDDRTSHAGLGAEVVCFAAGTMIDTENGPKAVETLRSGDMVKTRDSGLQQLRWVGKTQASAVGKTAPIVISKGAIGNDVDLVVSPQHAVLLEDWRAELFYGVKDALVRAVDLLGHDGVYRQTGGFITYCHILFDAHQLVRAAGVWSESLYPGEVTLQTLNDQAQREIAALFPDLTQYGPKSAHCLRSFEAKCLAL